MEDSENGILESKIVPSLTAVVIISDIIYKGTFNYEQVKLAGAQEPNDIITTIQNKINYHDISIVLFTSGTTGNPKAVGLTHYQMYNFTNILTIRMGFDKKQNKFCFHLPLFHLFGQAFIFLSLKCGGPLVLPSFYYNAEENLKIISEEGCTFVMGPPTMLADIIRVQKEKRLPLIAEEAITGSASCSDDVLRDLKEVLNIKRTFNVYGSTESLLVSMNIIDNYDTQVLNLIGEITDHLEVKIVDSSDNIVPIGTVGNLCVRGFSVLSNYLSQDGKSNDIDKDGWFKTGDAIYMDVNKKVYISGRLKDIINRGGEKISPAEVEEILKTHPDVLEVGVVGTYHERLGEEVCACLKIKPNSSLTLDEIKNFCKGKLSYYKIPSRIHILESFPKTNLGKLQRSILLEQVTKLEQLKGR